MCKQTIHDGRGGSWEGERGTRGKRDRTTYVGVCVLPLPCKEPNKSILIIRLRLFSSPNIIAVNISGLMSLRHPIVLSPPPSLLFSGSCCCSRWIDVPFSQYSFSEGEREAIAIADAPAAERANGILFN